MKLYVFLEGMTKEDFTYCCYLSAFYDIIGVSLEKVDLSNTPFVDCVDNVPAGAYILRKPITKEIVERLINDWRNDE